MEREREERESRHFGKWSEINEPHSSFKSTLLSSHCKFFSRIFNLLLLCCCWQKVNLIWSDEMSAKRKCEKYKQAAKEYNQVHDRTESHSLHSIALLHFLLNYYNFRSIQIFFHSTWVLKIFCGCDWWLWFVVLMMVIMVMVMIAVRCDWWNCNCIFNGSLFESFLLTNLIGN